MIATPEVPRISISLSGFFIICQNRHRVISLHKYLYYKRIHIIVLESKHFTLKVSFPMGPKSVSNIIINNLDISLPSSLSATSSAAFVWISGKVRDFIWPKVTWNATCTFSYEILNPILRKEYTNYCERIRNAKRIDWKKFIF